MPTLALQKAAAGHMRPSSPQGNCCKQPEKVSLVWPASASQRARAGMPHQQLEQDDSEYHPGQQGSQYAGSQKVIDRGQLGQ